MDNINLDDEIRTRKEKILRLKNEIKTLKDAKDVISGLEPGHDETDPEKSADSNDE